MAGPGARRAGQPRLAAIALFVFGEVETGRANVHRAYEPPGYFVDEQVSCPFRRSHHAYYFEPDTNGGTVMRNVIEFAAPFGPLGAIAEWGVLDWYMPQLIRNRNEHIKATAEARGPPAADHDQPTGRLGHVTIRPHRYWSDSESLLASLVWAERADAR